MSKPDEQEQPQLSFNETLARISTHLESEDVGAQETACATLVTLLSNTNEDPGDLSVVSKRLCGLVTEAKSAALQRNAAAAVAACMEVSEQAVQPALDARLPEKVVEQLQEGPSDDGLTFNLMVVLSVLGAAAPESALVAGALGALLARCDPSAQENLQEVAVDALCRLAAHSADAKASAAEQGAIPRLAAMLGSKHPEVRVRALLGLGMLLGESAERQRQLAEAPGAAAQLLALMRQSDDLDSAHIAGELFRGLARNPELRDKLAQAMRESQATAQEGDEDKSV